MNKLYPIIRRARRPLLPPDEPPQRVVIPVTVEPGPVEEVSVEIVQVIAAPEPSAPPANRSRKERKRAQTPAT